MIGLLLLALQAPAHPTVGDTIWVRRAVPLPPGYTARAPDWKVSGDVELLGRPEVAIEGDSAILRAPLVAWVPGVHRVDVPAPALLSPDGSMDTLESTTAQFVVAATLPDRPLDSLRPQPEAGLVARREVSFAPPLVAALLAVALLLPLHWWWRRRGKPLSAPDVPPPPAVPAARWADAGETRSVLAAGAATLRQAIVRKEPEAHRGLDTETCLALIETRHPDWPLDDLGRVLRALDEARFSSGSSAEALALHDDATSLASVLSGER
jgi:hypothetical protein